MGAANCPSVAAKTASLGCSGGIAVGTARCGKISLQDGAEGDADCPCQCGSGLAVGTARRWSIAPEDMHVGFQSAPPAQRGVSGQAGDGEDGSATPGHRARASYLLQSMGQPTNCSHREQAPNDSTEQYLSGVRAGNFRQFVEAVADGADIFATTLRGQTGLMLAAGSSGEGAGDIVKFLLEVGMDIEAEDNMGWTALLYACRNKSQEMIDYLLARSARLDVTTKEGETAPMLTALEPQSDRLVMSLLAKRASIQPRDAKGYSLLFYAVEQGRDELASFLIKKKANVKELSVTRTSVLMIAVAAGNLEIAKQLVRSKASINTKNITGNSPLMLSLRGMQEPCSKWLIDVRADVHAKNDDGDSALDFALAGDLIAVAGRIEQLLRKHAAMMAAKAEQEEQQRRQREQAEREAAQRAAEDEEIIAALS